jgi:uncharacterized membrane protein (DUF485 family)
VDSLDNAVAHPDGRADLTVARVPSSRRNVDAARRPRARPPSIRLSAQTVSLASGMTMVWFGVVLSFLTLGVALTWRVVGRGMIITCAVVAALCVATAIYDAHFINEQRHKIIEQLPP